MARRTFDVIDVTEILVHWHAGRSLSEMAQSLGVDRKTLRKYIAPAVAAGITPGGDAKSEQEWHELVRGWFPELADTRLRQVTWPAIAVHHDYIVAQLKAGVRMSTIWQRLSDERGLAASVASFRRYVAANVPEEMRRSQVVVWNPRPAEAVTDEGHTRANYSKELRERVEDTPYIIPDLASQLEIVDKSMNNRNQQSERRHVMRVLDLASRLGILDRSILQRGD